MPASPFDTPPPVAIRKRGKFMQAQAEKRLYRQQESSSSTTSGSSGTDDDKKKNNKTKHANMTSTAELTQLLALLQTPHEGAGAKQHSNKSSHLHDADDADADSSPQQEVRPLVLDDLPDDVTLRILRHLSAPDLLRLQAVSQKFQTLAASNAAGWPHLCQVLWRDKVFVAPEALAARRAAHKSTTTTTLSLSSSFSVSSSSLPQDGTNNSNGEAGGQAGKQQGKKKKQPMIHSTGPDTHSSSSATSTTMMDAYRKSIQDATERQYFRLEEFLYNPDTHVGTVWSFRFKESAGADWTAADPWYAGRQARQFVFLRDGTCQPWPTAAERRRRRRRRNNRNNGSRNNSQNSATASGNLGGGGGRNEAQAAAAAVAALAGVFGGGGGGAVDEPLDAERTTNNRGTFDDDDDLADMAPPPPPPPRGAGAAMAVAAAAGALPYQDGDIPPPPPPPLPPPPGEVGPDEGGDHDIDDEDNENNNDVHGPLLARMTWRLITRPMDLPTRPTGSYVRITVGGRDVPTYAVRRSPVGNWGFVMESCWGIFASFDLPSRRAPTPIPTVPASLAAHAAATAAGAAAPAPAPRRRLRRAADGTTRWVWESSTGDLDSTERSGSQHGNTNAPLSSSLPPQPPVDSWAALRNDSQLEITNEIQWREAFLYNVGARVLPEGEEATDDFDRAWGGLGV